MLHIQRIRHALIILIAGAVLVACSPQATLPPTVTPPPTITPTPAPTATTIPTRAPLPTANSPENAPSPDRDIAYVRVIHAGPTLDRVDAYVGDQAVAFGLRYLRAGGVVAVDAAATTLALRPAGGRPDADPLFSVPLTLNPDDALTVTLLGDAILTHPLSLAPLGPGQARLTLIHALPGGPPTTLADDNGDPAFPRVDFRQQSDPVTLPAGETRLTLERLLTAYPLTLEPRRSYTLVITGDPAAPDLIVADTPVPAKADLTFVNASPQVGPVDVYLDGAPLVTTVTPSSHNSPAAPTAGTQTITVYSAGADPDRIEPLHQATVTLAPDGETFLILLGPAADLTLVTHVDPFQPTAANDTRLTLINTLPNLPTIEETASTEQPIRLLYAQPITRTYTAQSLEFGFFTPATDQARQRVEAIPPRDFQAGRSYLVLITGQPGDDPLIIARTRGTTTETAPSNIGQIYIVNSTSQPIQVVIDGVIVAGALPQAATTAPQSLPPGNHTITLLNADTLDPLLTETVFTEAGRTQALIYDGSLSAFALETDTSDIIGSAQLRLINISDQATRPVSMAYMAAVTPDRRLSTVINASTDVMILPDSVPRIRNGAAARIGDATRFYSTEAGAYDIHLYDPATDRLLGSAYAVELATGGRYDVIARPGTELLALDVLVVRTN